MLPDLPVEIWLEIFQFSTYVHQHVSIKPLDPFMRRIKTTNAMGPNTPALAKQTKLALVLVSKSWRRIALQLLYEHIVIQSPRRANAVLQILDGNRTQGSDSTSSDVSLSYGQWTRHIEIYTFARGAEDMAYLQTLFKIFQCCPNVTMLTGNWMYDLPVEFLNALCKLFGASLTQLSWMENDGRRGRNPITTPSFLASFQLLRVLDLRKFMGNQDWSLQPEARSLLPLLEDLILSSETKSLRAPTMLQLPSLRNLILEVNDWEPGASQEGLDAFLKVHGHALISLDLQCPPREADEETSSSRSGIKPASYYISIAPDQWPNLHTITFPVTSPFILPDTQHPKVRRIGIRGATLEGLDPGTKTLATKEYLLPICKNTYPRLELIQTVDFLVEAEGGAANDVFIWWVEYFDRLGITLLDGEGVWWEYDSEDQDESRGK